MRLAGTGLKREGGHCRVVLAGTGLKREEGTSAKCRPARAISVREDTARKSVWRTWPRNKTRLVEGGKSSLMAEKAAEGHRGGRDRGDKMKGRGREEKGG